MQSITITAGEAFGSGGHESTQLCLSLMNRLREMEISNILDVGCGSGVLTVMAGQWWPAAQLAGCDIQPEALAFTLKNATTNGIEEARLSLFRSDGLCADEVVENGPYDLILFNILAEVMINEVTRMLPVIKPSGRLILSGILRWLAPHVLEVYEAAGFHLLRKEEQGQWVGLLMEYKKAID